MTDHRLVRTARLVLGAVTHTDIDELYALSSDPRVWTHLPAGRHLSREQTAEQVDGFAAAWQADGLGYWTARSPVDRAVLGVGGCAVRSEGLAWNLYYRFAPEQQGNGYASEVCAAALSAAQDVRPDLPVTAWLLEHNVASFRTALRAGLHVVGRGPDSGGTRVILADRELDEATLRELGAAVR